MVYAIIFTVSSNDGEFFILALLYWGLFFYFLLKIVGTIIGIIGSMKNWIYLVLGVSTLFDLFVVSLLILNSQLSY